jgi:transposase-like protein
VALLIDGIHLGKQVLVVALGIETSGKKHVLGLWQGATENTTVVKELLEDLVARGLSTERRYLFVIDGAEALRARIERVFGARAEVQRCQLHKRRNVKEYLPKNARRDYDSRMRNAYAMTEYAAAKAELEKILRQLERVNPSAARSLEEGLEETLTVHRLGIGELLRRSLATTNPIESCLSTVERVARNVKRYQPLRWTAAGLLDSPSPSGISSHSSRRRKVRTAESRHLQLSSGQFPKLLFYVNWYLIHNLVSFDGHAGQNIIKTT